jgi:hypothetical protein
MRYTCMCVPATACACGVCLPSHAARRGPSRRPPGDRDRTAPPRDRDRDGLLLAIVSGGLGSDTVMGLCGPPSRGQGVASSSSAAVAGDVGDKGSGIGVSGVAGAGAGAGAGGSFGFQIAGVSGGCLGVAGRSGGIEIRGVSGRCLAVTGLLVGLAL